MKNETNYTPEEIKKFESSRELTKKELILGGAQEIDGRLDITSEQFEKIRNEMNEDLKRRTDEELTIYVFGRVRQTAIQFKKASFLSQVSSPADIDLWYSLRRQLEKSETPGDPPLHPESYNQKVGAIASVEKDIGVVEAIDTLGRENKLTAEDLTEAVTELKFGAELACYGLIRGGNQEDAHGYLKQIIAVYERLTRVYPKFDPMEAGLKKVGIILGNIIAAIEVDFESKPSYKEQNPQVLRTHEITSDLIKDIDKSFAVYWLKSHSITHTDETVH